MADNAANEIATTGVFAVGSEILVNTTAASDQGSPQITALADGGFVVTWQSIEGLNAYEIRVRIYAADGEPGA